MTGLIEYHNFSWSGDPRWARASRFTRNAPLVVSILFLLSIIEIVVGSIWVVSLKSSMTVPQILQTIILPGLSFFNTLPSLHIHLLLRRNPPMLVIWFSTSLSLLYLVSILLYLISCTGSSYTSIPLGLRKVECYQGRGYETIGPGKALWGVVVAFSILSMLLYAVHASMAWIVRGSMKREEAENKDNGEAHVMSEDTQREARERWQRLARYEL